MHKHRRRVRKYVETHVILAGGAALPLMFHFLIEQFQVQGHYSEM